METVAMVRSFDNLTTKGRHPIIFDNYLVWNQQMRDELLRSYSKVRPGAVHVVGTPQFQFYFSPEYTGSREELFDLFKLDPQRPLLLYACCPKETVPHEVPIVAQLCADLRRIPEAQRPQLILRLHPVERHPDRWKPIAEEYPEVHWSTPWQTNPDNVLWSVPQQEEIKLLCMLVRYSDVVINVASTMSFDAALCDTPVVCVNYALPPFADFTKYINNFYDYDHYRPIANSGAIRIARSPEQLLSHVQEYLANPALDREKRAQLVADKCGPDPAHAVDLIARSVVELINR
jgi:hypothetical protein